MKTFIEITVLTLLALLLLPEQSAAQSVVNGPNGVFVVTHRGASLKNPRDTIATATVERAPDGTLDFQAIGESTRPASLAEFRARLENDRVSSALQKALGITNDADFWSYIQTHPTLASYPPGFGDIRLAYGLGLAWLDKDAPTSARGSSYRYRVRYTMRSGTVEVTDPESILPKPLASSVRPVQTALVEDERAIRIAWRFRPERRPAAILARLLRDEGGDGNFVEVQRLTAGYGNDSTATLLAVDSSVQSGRMYRYILEALDFGGTLLARSEPTIAFAINLRTKPLVQGLRLEEHPNGIRLRWEGLREMALFTGIEIARGREGEQPVPLDTVAADDTTWNDATTGLLGGYVYALRPLTWRDEQEYPSATAAITRPGKYLPPLPPSLLKATPERNGVRITWNRINEEGGWKWFVLRGIGEGDSMRIVSPGLTDTTYFDDDAALSGRTEYAWAVMAVSASGGRSDLSPPVFARPVRPVRPPAPTTLAAIPDARTVSLRWDPARRFDGAIAGYRVYRRRAASARDTNGFALIDTLTPDPLFDDQTAMYGERYEYAVRSVDIYGIESALSPRTEATLLEGTPLVPPRLRVVSREEDGSIEVQWELLGAEGITGYALYRRSNEGAWAKVATVDAETSGWTDTGARGRGVWEYAVATVRNNRESGKSGEMGVRVE